MSHWPCWWQGFLWRGDGRVRAVSFVLGTFSAGAYAWFHLAVYESLTPYDVNVVYTGMTSAELVTEHVSVGDQVYRLWGLFVPGEAGCTITTWGMLSRVTAISRLSGLEQSSLRKPVPVPGEVWNPHI